jgi:hypothetical protein
VLLTITLHRIHDILDQYSRFQLYEALFGGICDPLILQASRVRLHAILAIHHQEGGITSVEVRQAIVVDAL